MEIHHRQGAHTRFTSARCDDPQDAQKVTASRSLFTFIIISTLVTIRERDTPSSWSCQTEAVANLGSQCMEINT